MIEQLKDIIVFVGPHGAGKSTIGSAMPKDIFSFYNEIGNALRKDVKCCVTKSCKLFDLEVMRREFERDAAILKDIQIPVIESWHVGNIAFAYARGNQSIAEMYIRLLGERRCQFRPFFVRIHISDKAFLQRTCERDISPKVSLAFYRIVENYEDNFIETTFGKSCIILELDAEDDILVNVQRVTVIYKKRSKK